MSCRITSLIVSTFVIFFVSILGYPVVSDKVDISMQYKSDTYADTFWQVFYTLCDDNKQFFAENRSTKSRDNTPNNVWKNFHCSLFIPLHARIQKLRIDPREFPGSFEIKDITVMGKNLSETVSLSQLSFSNDLTLVKGDLKDILYLNSAGDDPFFIIDYNVNIGGKLAINWNNVASLITLFIIFYFIILQIYKEYNEFKIKSNIQKCTIVHYKDREFKNIEFLRFMLVMYVVFEHLAIELTPLGGSYNIFYNFISFGRSQLFFVIAGFFLFYNDKQLKNTVFFFVKKRWLRMSSLLIFATILGYVIIHFDFVRQPLEANILDALLLNFLTDSNWFMIIPGWYVNSLFLLSTIFFIIFKVFKKKYAMFITIIIAVICCNLNARDVRFGTSLIWERISGAAFSLSLGILLSECYKKLYKGKYIEQLTNKNIVFITVIELLIFCILCVGLYGRGLGVYLGNTMMSGCFVLLIWLFLIRKGLISRVLNNNISIYFGKYTYSIFITHYILIMLVRIYLIPNYLNWTQSHFFIVSFGSIIISLLLAIACHHLVEIPLSRWTASKFLYRN